MGASRDGWIGEDGAERQGVLEVKAPYSINNVNVTNIHPCKLEKHPKCCLELFEDKDKPRLKRNHNYYYQVQGELAILGVPWSDFAVWPRAGIYVERIEFDRNLWVNEMLRELTKFYATYFY